MLYYSLRILSAYFVFAYPAYMAFKSLSHRPLSEPDLERWVKHFCLVSLVLAVEYTGVEAAISWLPFYYEVKALFMLFLALPQTQGAVYLYDLQVGPFFTRNEAEIDAHIASASNNILVFLQSRLGSVLRIIIDSMGRVQSQAATNAQQAGQNVPPPAVGIPVQVALNLWSTIGGAVTPSIGRVSGGTSSTATTAAPPGPIQLPSAPDPARVPLPPTPAK